MKLNWMFHEESGQFFIMEPEEDMKGIIDPEFNIDSLSLIGEAIDCTRDELYKICPEARSFNPKDISCKRPLNSTIAFFDLETTGVNPIQDRIVQISVIKTDLDLRILEKRKLLINPTIPIPKEASEVHGITDEMVAGRAELRHYATSLRDFLDGCILAGFNSDRFDIPLLSEEFGRLDITWPDPSVLTIDCHKIFVEREKRNLEAALMFYAGEKIEGAHDAENDVLATIKVLEGQMFLYDLGIEDVSRKRETVDVAGKLIWIDGKECYGFGKDKNLYVKDYPGFGLWMLKNDFPKETKSIIKKILNLP